MTTEPTSVMYPPPQDCGLNVPTVQDRMTQGTYSPPPPYHVKSQKNSTPQKSD